MPLWYNVSKGFLMGTKYKYFLFADAFRLEGHWSTIWQMSGRLTALLSYIFLT